MNARFLSVKLIFATTLALAVPCLWAQDGLTGALSQANFTVPFQHTLAVADLDNDNKPDGAVLLDCGWPGAHSSCRIQLHFTGSTNTELTFDSTEQALAVSARDMDNDGLTDLVVEDAFAHKLLHVWINEGHGDFHEEQAQNFPSLELRTSGQLQSPFNQPDSLIPCLPPRGFEVPILTAPLLGRPPSSRKPQVVSNSASAASRAGTLNSPRAPPLA